MIDRRILFRNYLLKKLGFPESDFLIKYIEYLTLASPGFKYLEAIPTPNTDEYETIEFKGNISHHLKEGNTFRLYENKHGLFIPKNYSIIDFLNYEQKVKKNLLIRFKTNATEFISATDLSNYTYCPASFSIGKTFDIEKIESAYIGTNMHEMHRLIHFLPSEKTKNYSLGKGNYLNLQLSFCANNEQFFKDIKRSYLIYYGHLPNQQKKYFKSPKGDYVGQPDYIFKNENNHYFVVEEKFQYQNFNRQEQTPFYTNHINQVISYLHGIKDYEIQYGYLVYWKYAFDQGEPFVHSCYITRIEKNNETRNQISTVYNKLKKLITNKEETFDPLTRNPNKCANCISNLLCGHKTGRFANLKYPYSKEYLKTYYAEFPEELKKDYIPEELRFKGDLPVDLVDKKNSPNNSI